MALFNYESLASKPNFAMPQSISFEHNVGCFDVTMKASGYLIIPDVQELNCSHDVQGYLNAAAKALGAQFTLPKVI